jgi:hypothetical protein
MASNVSGFAVEQRRAPSWDGQRVDVSDPEQVAPVRVFLGREAHLGQGHVEAAGQLLFRFQRVGERLPVGEAHDHLRPGVVHVAGDDGAELDLLVGFGGVTEAGGVVGAKHHVRVELAVPWGDHSRGDDGFVLRAADTGQDRQRDQPEGPRHPPRRELQDQHDRQADRHDLDQ